MTPIAQRELLRCFRTALTGGAADTAAVLSAGDSRALFDLARRHGVLPLVWPVLERTLDPSVRSDAERRRDFALQMAARARTTLGEAAEALAAAQVPFLVLKGPALAARLRTEAWRTFNDLDLLVRSEDRFRALAALTHGQLFARRGSAWSRALIRTFHFHETLEPYRAMRVRAEVHWRAFDRANLLRIDERTLFERRVRLAAAGQRIPVLSVEDDFLYLCIHAAKHGLANLSALAAEVAPEWFCDPGTGNRLRWFADLYRFLRDLSDRVNWAATARRLRSWNAAEEVDSTLGVLHRLTGLERAREVRVQLVPEPPAPAGLRRQRLTLNRAAMRENKRFAVRPIRVLLLAGVLFPGRRRLASYYGRTAPGLLALRACLHPFHMVRKYFR